MLLTPISVFKRQVSSLHSATPDSAADFNGDEPFCISYQRTASSPAGNSAAPAAKKPRPPLERMSSQLSMKSSPSGDDLVHALATSITSSKADRNGKSRAGGRNLLGNAPAFIRNLSRAVVTFNAGTSEILTVNDAATRLFRCSDREELIGKRIDSLIAPTNETKPFRKGLLQSTNIVDLPTDGRMVELIAADGTTVTAAVWSQTLTQPSYDSVEYQYINALACRRISVCPSMIPGKSDSFSNQERIQNARQAARRASITDQRPPELQKCLAILESVDRLTAFCSLDESHLITEASCEFASLFNKEPAELAGSNLETFIPKFTSESAIEGSFKRSHACGVLPDGTAFPMTLNLKRVTGSGGKAGFVLKAWVYPGVSGLITLNEADLSIRCCSNQLGIIAFGYKQGQLTGLSINQLIPGFALDQANKHVAHDSGIVVSNGHEKHADDSANVKFLAESRSLAVHKDGHSFFVDYNVFEIFLSGSKPIISLWLTRTNLVRRGKSESAESLKEKKQQTQDDEDHLISGAYSKSYETFEEIGKGAFGCVRLARRVSDVQNVVVVKFIRKDKVLPTAWHRLPDGSKQPIEVFLLSRLDCPNIVRVFESFENEWFVQAVMEKHGSMCMDLYEFIEHHPRMDEALVSYIFRQICTAVFYLLDTGICHGDIKDENVIINEHFACKLIDFGSAAYMDPEQPFSTFCGTVDYCSPEVLLGNKYRGPELEVWSLGCVLFILRFGINPFPTPQDAVEGFLDYPWTVSDILKHLFSIMLCPIPEHRATVEELRDHPWIFQKVNIEEYSFDDVLRLNR